MPETPVVRIDTLEDLKRVLFIQRQITRKAHDELEAVASDHVLGDHPDAEEVQKLMREESDLLSSYAMRPTLSEWANQGFESESFLESPSTGSWGATFGVAILTGELVLEQIRTMHPQFGSAIRHLFVSLLTAEAQMKGAIDEGEFEKLVMSFNVTKPDGSPIENEEIKEKIRKSLADVVSTIVATGMEYGLFEERDGGSHCISPLGIRVMLHMTDVQKFLTIIGEAHKKFQSDETIMNTLAAEVTIPSPKRPVKPRKPSTSGQ